MYRFSLQPFVMQPNLVGNTHESFAADKENVKSETVVQHHAVF